MPLVVPPKVFYVVHQTGQAVPFGTYNEKQNAADAARNLAREARGTKVWVLRTEYEASIEFPNEPKLDGNWPATPEPPPKPDQDLAARP